MMLGCCEVSEFIFRILNRNLQSTSISRDFATNNKNQLSIQRRSLSVLLRVQLVHESVNLLNAPFTHFPPSCLLLFLSLQRSVLHRLQLRFYVFQLRAEIIDGLNEPILRHGVNVLRLDE